MNQMYCRKPINLYQILGLIKIDAIENKILKYIKR